MARYRKANEEVSLFRGITVTRTRVNAEKETIKDSYEAKGLIRCQNTFATAVSTYSSVLTGEPRTGWPEATVDPSPRRRSEARAAKEERLGLPSSWMVRRREVVMAARVAGRDRRGL